MRRVAVLLALLACSAPAEAGQQQLQLRALLAKHFLSIHQAVPLHNNGEVKSGDVLHMPEEATFTSRDKCYKLPMPPRYLSLDAEFIQTTVDVAAEVGGALPLQRIAQIEASIGGKLRQVESIVLDPLSQEEPQGGYSALLNPNPVPECGIIRNILAGKAKDYILATRVFYGIQNALVSLDLGGKVAISADIEKKIKALLGTTLKLNVKASGSYATLEYSKSPDERSLAVQSAVVNPQQLARIYLQYRTENGFQLELRVREYLTGSDPGLLETARIAIGQLLSIMEVRQPSVAALYSQVFGGDGAVRATEANIPRAQWNALATVAAAHEIVAPQ
jgi:hypothetical protein